LGFSLVGVAPAVAPPHLDRFGRWLDDGFHGEMHYLVERRKAYRHPSGVLEGARSVMMLGMNYRTVGAADPKPGQGRVSRYAWGPADYHDAIHDRLKRLVAIHRDLAPQAAARGVVDTAPLLEREFAQLAGLGWIGKNTMLLNTQLGSWFFLAALLSSEELDDDEPFTRMHCGTCRACIDACPTGALVDPHRLDARRCLSYLTIELQSAVPEALRPMLGSWLFGCDICQEVCPWNRDVPAATPHEFEPAPGMNPIDLLPLFSLDDTAYRARFRRTPLWRPKRRGLLRNAALVLGNRPTEAALPALTAGLADSEPLVREASAWALGQFDAPSAHDVLADRCNTESDPAVIEAIRRALE
jgi:epoxyqueuosine reductase